MLIAEQLMLLSIDDESGKVAISSYGGLQYGLIGGLLMDLVFRKKITLENKKIQIIDITSTSDALLDMLLEKLIEAKKPKDIEEWLRILDKIARIEYSKEIFNRLASQGIIKIEEKTKLKIFHVVRRPIIKPDIKEQLLQNIEAIILEEAEPDSQMVGLLSLIVGVRLDHSLFSKEFRKQANRRIKVLAASDKIGIAVKEMIEAIEAAVMVSVIAATSA